MNKAKIMFLGIILFAVVGALATKAKFSTYYIYTDHGYTTIPIDHACPLDGIGCTYKILIYEYQIYRYNAIIGTYIPIKS